MLEHSSKVDTYAVYMSAPLVVVLFAAFLLRESVDRQAWIAGIGLTGWIGQHFITEAFRVAPASAVAPFEYTALLWAALIDWIV